MIAYGFWRAIGHLNKEFDLGAAVEMILESGGFSYLEERLLRLRIRQADVKKMIVDAESGNFKTVENALAMEMVGWCWRCLDWEGFRCYQG